LFLSKFWSLFQPLCSPLLSIEAFASRNLSSSYRFPSALHSGLASYYPFESEAGYPKSPLRFNYCFLLRLYQVQTKSSRTNAYLSRCPQWVWLSKQTYPIVYIL
jgi:hypothetical protein